MGVINATPDSFYAKSRTHRDEVVARASAMLQSGAQIIDIGGMSSRPGAQIVSPEEEKKRVLPLIEEVKQQHPDAIISIDTVNAEVAAHALNVGAAIVNDISAWSIDPELLDLVVERNVPYVLMHMLGTPEDMQQSPHYQDVVLEVLDFFIEKLYTLSSRHVHDIIVDPGIGFGKRIEDNFSLIKDLSTFRMLEKPILIGLSRKSFIQKTLSVDASGSLHGTTALHMVALQNGARILRVHDVQPAIQCIKLFQSLQDSVRNTKRE